MVHIIILLVVVLLLQVLLSYLPAAAIQNQDDDISTGSVPVLLVPADMEASKSTSTTRAPLLEAIQKALVSSSSKDSSNSQSGVNTAIFSTRLEPLEISFEQCIDFESISDEEIDEIKIILWSKKILLLQFLHQNVSSNELVNLSKRFSAAANSSSSFESKKDYLLLPGETLLSIHVDSGSRLDSHPEVTVISNIINKEGKAIGLNGTNVEGFHSDLSWSKVPGIVTFLYSIVHPLTNCGNTIFVDSENSYETLPSFVKNRLNTSVGRFCYLKTTENKDRLSSEESKIVENCAEHPVFTTHPITKKRNIFVNPNDATDIIGMSSDESAFWLDYLFRHIESSEKYIHRWKENSMLIWDNRSVQHKATGCSSDFPRLLHRTVTLSA